MVGDLFSYISKNFENIGVFFTILSFFVSLYVLWEVRSIKNRFRTKARTPEILEELGKFSTELNICLSDIEESKNQIIIIAKRLRYTLKSLKKIRNKEISTDLKGLLKRTNKFKKKSNSLFSRSWQRLKSKKSFEDEAWEMYGDILALQKGLNTALEEIYWE